MQHEAPVWLQQLKCCQESDMWMNLTSPRGKVVLVDTSKVIHMREIDGGTQIFYALLSPSKDGSSDLTSINVKETVQQIGRALRSKAL